MLQVGAGGQGAFGVQGEGGLMSPKPEKMELERPSA